tara:strand:- start:5110 stop:6327 length:1218 start_codon:yes stop_codon:yes gene_type:complete
MSAFEFTALNASGAQERGLIEGDTPRHARSQLRDRGLMPLEIREVKEKNTAASGALFSRGGSISTTELTLFTRQLSTLVRSGLPLDESLTAVSQQSESRRVSRIALGVRSAVLEGSSLASALNEFPNAFPQMFRATIEAGEQSGRLDMILDRLAQYVERRQAMRQKVLLATFYPAILTFVAVGVVILLLTYVVPQVVGVYADIDQDLPRLTQIMIAFSDFLRDYGLYLTVALVVAFFAFNRMMRVEDFQRKVHRFQLRLPMIGRLTRSGNTGRFTRTLGILFGSGVPILDAMRIGTQVVSNVPMRDAIEVATTKVREGAPLARSLGESKLFPPIALHLIASGESSGRLDEMLDRAAENQESEVETRVGALMAVFEPILILTMGAVVLLIVLAILLPIFDLNQLVK